MADELRSVDAHASGALHGYLVEFATPGALVHAAEKVRDAGFTKWDAYTPFPVHGMDRAMGIRRTKLPWLAMAGGVCGGLGGLALACFANATEIPGLVVGYRYLISDKPFFSIPAFIPVVFELTILLAAISTFLFMLILNNLPFWFHSLDAHQRFGRATSDGFFLEIEARDPQFDREATLQFLESLGARRVDAVEEQGD